MISGIIHMLRTGARWRDFSPRTASAGAEQCQAVFAALPSTRAEFGPPEESRVALDQCCFPILRHEDAKVRRHSEDVRLQVLSSAMSGPKVAKIHVASAGIGFLAILFGLLTIASGGGALFGGEAARLAVGAAVPFVLWFNFVAGFAYVVAGIGLLMRLRWSVWLSAWIAAATVLVFVAFGIHVLLGGPYETRTVGAMTIRSLVWIGIAVAARRATRRPSLG